MHQVEGNLNENRARKKRAKAYAEQAFSGISLADYNRQIAFVDMINTPTSYISSASAFSLARMLHRFRPIVDGTGYPIFRGSPWYNSVNSVRSFAGAVGNFTFVLGTGIGYYRYLTDSTYGGVEFTLDTSVGVIGSFGGKIASYAGISSRFAGPISFFFSGMYFGTKHAISVYTNHPPDSPVKDHMLFKSPF